MRGHKWLKLLEPAIIHQDMSLANVAIGELNEVMDRVGTMIVNHCSLTTDSRPTATTIPTTMPNSTSTPTEPPAQTQTMNAHVNV